MHDPEPSEALSQPCCPILGTMGGRTACPICTSEMSRGSFLYRDDKLESGQQRRMPQYDTPTMLWIIRLGTYRSYQDLRTSLTLLPKISHCVRNLGTCQMRLSSLQSTCQPELGCNAFHSMRTVKILDKCNLITCCTSLP